MFDILRDVLRGVVVLAHALVVFAVALTRHLSEVVHRNVTSVSYLWTPCLGVAAVTTAAASLVCVPIVAGVVAVLETFLANSAALVDLRKN